MPGFHAPERHECIPALDVWSATPEPVWVRPGYGLPSWAAHPKTRPPNPSRCPRTLRPPRSALAIVRLRNGAATAPPHSALAIARLRNGAASAPPRASWIAPTSPWHDQITIDE